MFGASTINFLLSSEIGNPSLGTEENIDVISSANDLKNWLQSVSAQNPIILFSIPFIRVADIENFPVHFPQKFGLVLCCFRRNKAFLWLSGALWTISLQTTKTYFLATKRIVLFIFLKSQIYFCSRKSTFASNEISISLCYLVWRIPSLTDDLGKIPAQIVMESCTDQKIQYAGLRPSLSLSFLCNLEPPTPVADRRRREGWVVCHWSPDF